MFNKNNRDNAGTTFEGSKAAKVVPALILLKKNLSHLEARKGAETGRDKQCCPALSRFVSPLIYRNKKLSRHCLASVPADLCERPGQNGPPFRAAITGRAARRAFSLINSERNRACV